MTKIRLPYVMSYSFAEKVIDEEQEKLFVFRKDRVNGHVDTKSIQIVTDSLKAESKHSSVRQLWGEICYNYFILTLKIEKKAMTNSNFDHFYT